MPAAVRSVLGIEEGWKRVIAKSDIIDNFSDDLVELMKQHTNPEVLLDRMKAFEFTSPGPIAQGILETTAEVLYCQAAMRRMLVEGQDRLELRKQAVCKDNNAGQMASLEHYGKQAVEGVAACRDKAAAVVDPKNIPKILVAWAARTGTDAHTMTREDKKKALKEERGECNTARHEAVAYLCDTLTGQTDWQESFVCLHGDVALPGELAAHHRDAELHEQKMSAAYQILEEYVAEVSRKQKECAEALTSAESRSKLSEVVAREKYNEYLKAQAMHDDDRVEEKGLRKVSQGLSAEVANVAEELAKAGEENKKGHEVCDEVKKDALVYGKAFAAKYRDAMKVAAESKAGSLARFALNVKLAARFGQLASKNKKSELEYLQWEKEEQEEKLAQLQREKASDNLDLLFDIYCEEEKLKTLEKKIAQCTGEVTKMESRVRAAEEACNGLKDFTKYGPALDDHQLDAEAAKIAEDSWGDDFKLFVIPVPASGGAGGSAAAASGVPSTTAAAAVDPGTTAAPEDALASAVAIQVQRMMPQFAKIMERQDQLEKQNENLRFEYESVSRQKESLEKQVRQLSGLGRAGQRAIRDDVERADATSDAAIDASFEKVEHPQLGGESK